MIECILAYLLGNKEFEPLLLINLVEYSNPPLPFLTDRGISWVLFTEIQDYGCRLSLTVRRRRYCFEHPFHWTHAQHLPERELGNTLLPSRTISGWNFYLIRPLLKVSLAPLSAATPKVGGRQLGYCSTEQHRSAQKPNANSPTLQVRSPSP